MGKYVPLTYIRFSRRICIPMGYIDLSLEMLSFLYGNEFFWGSDTWQVD